MADYDLREIVDRLMLQAAAAAQSCFKRGKQIVDDYSIANTYTRDGARLISQGNEIVKVLADDQRKRDEIKRGEGPVPEFTDAELDDHVNKLLVATLRTMPAEERAAMEAVVAGD